MDSLRLMPTDSTARKERPLYRGLLNYFPAALTEVAHVSFRGNEQHNPGQPMHWAREKSQDHEDCIMRHLMERGTIDSDGLRHSAKLAWRALALLQLELEAEEGERQLPEIAGLGDNDSWCGPAPAAEKALVTGTPQGHRAYLITPIGYYAVEVPDNTVFPLPSGVDPSQRGVTLESRSQPPASRELGRITPYGVQYKIPSLMSVGVDMASPGEDHNSTLVGGDNQLHVLEYSRQHPGQVLLSTERPPVERKRQCYIAGPMRGIEKFNFPAFDAARDLAISLGWAPISPADIDRDSGFHEDTPPTTVYGPEQNRVFAERDTAAILSLRAEHGDALALLPGWERSTGARAEFFLAAWVGLPIVDALTFKPFCPAAGPAHRSAVALVGEDWDAYWEQFSRNTRGDLTELVAAALRILNGTQPTTKGN